MNHMTVRWTTWIALMLAICIGVISCDKKGSDSIKSSSAGQPDASKPKPLVCVSLLTLTNPFFKDMADTMQAEGQKHGYEVVVTSGEFDPAKQKDQVKDFLVRKASAIILTPCDSKSIGTAIIEANTAGVPVFTADVKATADGIKVIGHCGTDNLEGGRVAGKAIVEALGGKGRVAMIDQPEVETGLMRETGCLEELAKAPGIEVVAKLPSGGARDKGFAAAQDLIQSHPDVTAIFCVNDPTALGVMAALEKAGKLNQIKVVGFDGQLEARQAVKDGKLYATVMQYPRKIASVTIDNIAKYLGGEDVPAKTLLPPSLYTQSDTAKDAELK
jgi:ribose transport system substrate-binding protein